MEFIPVILIAGFVGYCIGYGSGRRVKAEKAIAEAPELDLLREVKRRRLEARLADEVDKQVERDVGSRPPVPY